MSLARSDRATGFSHPSSCQGTFKQRPVGVSTARPVLVSAAVTNIDHIYRSPKVRIVSGRPPRRVHTVRDSWIRRSERGAPVGEPNVAVWLLPPRPRSPQFESSGSWPAARSRFLRRPHTWATPPAAISRIGPTRASAGLGGTLNARPNVQNTLNPRTLRSPAVQAEHLGG
jgi:hypothetical protein